MIDIKGCDNIKEINILIKTDNKFSYPILTSFFLSEEGEAESIQLY